ncbi:endolysin [Sinorhizobium phage PBC5]|uniref:endolysin n=1 Tax=Sinorhizobium phage PBC5 TaxID=179237 RepID=UPI001BE72080|nr:endolysin [Sinorhizobium phage PBC5]
MTAKSVIPAEWLPPAKMLRIICHWTAGNHKATSFDREHYHLLVEGDGTLVRGLPSITLNEAPAKKGYAAHTLNCNSGSIGVSLCCMAGATEAPFAAGSAPMTPIQWSKLASVVAELCRHYRIDVTPKTVLSHAEVQPNLGILQRGKWDYTRLPFDPSVKGATAVGDRLRAAVKADL